MKDAYVQTYVFPIVPLYEHRDCMKANVNVYCMTEFSVAVVGEKEQSGGTVNVRTRDNVVHGEFSIEAVAQKFQALKDKHSQNSEVDF